MDADREHQQDDADFGHDFESVNVSDSRTWGQRTEDEASKDVAEENRLTEAPREKAADEGSGEDHRDVAVDERVFGHVRSSSNSILKRECNTGRAIKGRA
jgi:hypothetical protein